MLGPLMRTGAYVALWLKLKPRLKGLILLAVGVTIILTAHSEYLDYLARSQNNHFLALSYAAKWSAAGVLFFLYWLLVERPLNAATGVDKVDNQRADRSVKAVGKEGPLQDDGFNFVRSKRQLKSRTEELLDE